MQRVKELTIALVIPLFSTWLKGRGSSESTIKTKIANLQVFSDFLDEKGISDLRDVKRETILRFLDWMKTTLREKYNAPLKEKTRRTVFTTVKQLFLCLFEHQKILVSPVETVRCRWKKSDHKETLSEEETGIFLDSIDIHSRLGLRDRVLFELIYSSGLRAAEAAALEVKDYDPKSRLLWIHQSKFSKDRRVPVTDTAAWYLDLYLKGVKAPHRPLILSGGYRFTTSGINTRFKMHLKRCGLYRPGLSTHSLRHSCASHLLAHGAEIRYVQELLGHESVETTVVYSNQNEESIKAAYRQHHPRENRYFREITDSYLTNLENLVQGSLKQREKNRKALARKMSK